MIMAVLVAATSFAQKPGSLLEGLQKNAGRIPAKVAANMGADRAIQLINRATSKHKAPAKAPEIIKDTPEGTVSPANYRVTMGWAQMWGYILPNNEDGMLGKIVEGADGCLYVYNPVGGLVTDSYLKLEKGEGDKYVAKFPQDIYSEEIDGEVLVAQLNLYKFFVDDMGEWYAPVTAEEHANEQTFTYKDGVLTQDVYDPTDSMLYIVGLGAFDESTGGQGWIGYGDFANEWKTCPYQKVEAPATVEFQPYSITAGDDFFVVKAGFDAGNVYIKNLIGSNPEGTIKGVIADGKAVFESGQYLGPDGAVGYHEFLRTAISKQVWDPDWEEFVTETEDLDQLVLDFHSDTNTFDSQEDGVALVVNRGVTPYTHVAFINPVIAPYQEKAGTPADPEVIDFDGYNADAGYGYVKFNIPITDTEGNFLDKNKLYYNVLIDGEVETFYTDEYQYFPYDMTDIPMDFADAWDLYITSPSERMLYFYFDGFDTIGVQSTYTGGGETRKSSIATLNVTAINNTAGGNSVKSVVYHDMAGRTVNAAAKGMLIKTATMADGTVKTTKVVRR